MGKEINLRTVRVHYRLRSVNGELLSQLQELFVVFSFLPWNMTELASPSPSLGGVAWTPRPTSRFARIGGATTH
jgi:hypothetical protein